jgi:hypothetical protein
LFQNESPVPMGTSLLNSRLLYVTILLRFRRYGIIGTNQILVVFERPGKASLG